MRESEAVANAAATLRIDAQAKGGELLKAVNPKPGRPNADTMSVLKSAGVTQQESKRWQKVADIPVTEHGAYVILGPAAAASSNPH